MINVLVIGAGPAGISAAIYAKRTGMEVLVIGKDQGALAKADKVENYYGFGEPVKGVDLVEEGIQQALRLGIKVAREEVINIEAMDHFVVKTNKETYKAESVIFATGSPRQVPNIKGIKEFEGKGVSYCAVCDAFFYRNKTVAVLGCCEYAMNEAKELSNVVKSIALVTNGIAPQGEIPEKTTVITKPIKEFKGENSLDTIVFEDGETLSVDGLFVAYGVAGSSDFARKLGVACENNRIIVDETMATNMPGLFAAGDCTGGIYQIAKAVYDGSVAGTSASRYVRKKRQS